MQYRAYFLILVQFLQTNVHHFHISDVSLTKHLSSWTSQTSLSSLAANHWSHLITESLVLAVSKVGQTADEFLDFLRHVLHLCTVPSNTHTQGQQPWNKSVTIVGRVRSSFLSLRPLIDTQNTKTFSSVEYLLSHCRTFEGDYKLCICNITTFSVFKPLWMYIYIKKTYYMSGLILSSCFPVCMQETLWRAFSTRLSHLCSACSSSSQSEMDIISGWATAAPTLEIQDSICSSSAIICPWIPENNMYTNNFIKRRKKKTTSSSN